MELYSLNFPNGKRYIGCSIESKRRFYFHKRHAELGWNYLVHRAILKYGPDNIKLQILCKGPEDYIKELEIKAIQSYKTWVPKWGIEFGYNIQLGGTGASPGVPLTQEHKDKISNGLKGRPSPRKGQKASEETRQKMRNSNLGSGNPMYGKVSAMKGRKQSPESIEKSTKALRKAWDKRRGFELNLETRKIIANDPRSCYTVGFEYGISKSHVLNLRKLLRGKE